MGCCLIMYWRIQSNDRSYFSYARRKNGKVERERSHGADCVSLAESWMRAQAGRQARGRPPRRSSRNEPRRNSFESWRIAWTRDAVRRRSVTQDRGIELSLHLTRQNFSSVVRFHGETSILGQNCNNILRITTVRPRCWLTFARLPSKEFRLVLPDYIIEVLLKRSRFLIIRSRSYGRSSDERRADSCSQILLTFEVS